MQVLAVQPGSGEGGTPDSRTCVPMREKLIAMRVIVVSSGLHRGLDGPRMDLQAVGKSPPLSG